MDEGTPLSNYLEGISVHSLYVSWSRVSLFLDWIQERKKTCRDIYSSQNADNIPIGTGEREEPEWQEPGNNPDYDSSPPPSPPRDFAPRGFPKVRRRFRDKLPKPLQVDIPHLSSNINFDDIQNHAFPFLESLRLVAEAVTSSIGHIPPAAFLERVRLAIVQSQLLDNPLVAGTQLHAEPSDFSANSEQSHRGITSSGAVAAIVLGFGAATLIRWFWLGGIFPTWKRLCSSLAVLAVVSLVVRAYIRREIMKSIQEKGLAEATKFITLSKELDGVNSAALNFVMEVELVSRGYRL